MDPLSALSLACNVVQFIDFVGKLVSTTGEIAGSAKCAKKRIIDIESTCTTLKTLTTKLGTMLFNRNANGFSQTNPAIVQHMDALEALAAECKPVCDQLLESVEGLRVKGIPRRRRIRPAVVAIRTILAEKKMADLEDRLRRFQNQISLHFFPLLSLQQASIQGTLTRLQEDNRMLLLDQATKLDIVSANMSTLIQRVRSLGTVDVIPHPESLEDFLSRLSLAEKDFTASAKEQILLRSLNFESRPYRHGKIPEAHASTFEWIFPPHNNGAGDKSLYTWLKSGKGSFWIYGKPGSGKSTLLKFITAHRATRKVLDERGAGQRVIMAEHYFWSAGMPLQKSLTGLLQTLLFDILRRCPELIKDIFPEQWENTGPNSDPADKRWVVKELYGGLRALAVHASLPARVCIFIDDLDEYDGDHFELCQLLTELSALDNFKCCVSSRPWNDFKNAFAGDLSRNLCIHQHTLDDIQTYASDRLEGHLKWHSVCSSEALPSELIAKIADRAQGVFLWAFLVTRLLRKGIVNGDRMDDLDRLLDSLPADLELFFKRMIDNVEPVYHGSMSRALQITIHARVPLHLTTYCCNEYEEWDEEYAIRRAPEVGLMVSRTMPYPSTIEPCQLRINARCGGLVGVNDRGRVEFIHRAVRDFLLTQPMYDYLHQKASFKVNLSIIKALIFQARCIFATPDLTCRHDFGLLWKACPLCVNNALDEDERTCINILESILNIPHDHEVDDFCPFRRAVD